MPDENVEEAKPAPEAKGKAVVPAAGGGRAVAAAGAGGPAVVVVPAPPQGVTMPQVSRRKVLQIGFWTGLGAMVLGIFVTLLNSLYPRGITGFGTTISAGSVDALLPGKKIHNLDAKAWLVKFDDTQAGRNPPAVAGSVMALYHRCVHLGCTVPYREDFTFEDPRNGQTYAGWFRCPCHGSTYSDAGVRVFGPAPRSLDTFDLTIDGSGTMQVNTGKITSGNEDNPSRAILPPS
jgi:cytochrome b6-f complex iron-sulfur subunit